MKYQPKIKDRYGEEYFQGRMFNDRRRLKQFVNDKNFMNEYISSGTICDVGCSTGEFLKFIEWNGPRFGMEISDHARAIASSHICFDRNILTEKDFFDCVVFRGTLQHIDEPFRFLKSSFEALRPGGFLFLLVVPNTNSVLYRLKQNLPFLDPNLNFYVPGKKELINVLKNFDFEIVDVRYDYWNSPYRDIFLDHFKFLGNVFSAHFFKHAFWDSIFHVAVRKPEYE